MMPILHTLHSAIFLTKIYESSNTLCLSAPAESTPETSPVKIWLVKPLLAEKRLNFSPPRCILHSSVYSSGNIG